MSRDKIIFLGGSGGSGDALVANPLSQFAATTSAQLAGVISDETGTDALVFANTPTLVTPALGAATGTSIVLTGALTTGSGGSVAGAVTLTEGTAPSLTANAFTIHAPTDVAAGGLSYIVPAAAATGVMLATDSSGVMTVSHVAPSTSGNVLTSNGTTWTSTAPSGTWSATSTNVQTQLALGTTTASGYTLTNTTAAAAGAQQVSPAEYWNGQGWKTDATAASQEVSFRAYVLPVQGAAAPTATWLLQSSINGAAHATILSVGNTGTIITTSSVNVGAGFYASSGNNLSIGTQSFGNIFTAPSATGIGTFLTRQNFSGLIHNAGGVKRVATQFDKTDTTLADVTDLSVALVAATSYQFEAVLFTTSNVGGGVKVAVASSGSVTSIIYEGFTVDGGVITQTRSTSSAGVVGAVTAVTAACITIRGSITTNAAGNLTVQFAENVATATSSVLVGSYLKVTGY